MKIIEVTIQHSCLAFPKASTLPQETVFEDEKEIRFIF